MIPTPSLDQQLFASVSSDGHYVAYSSSEAGSTHQVFIRPYPVISTARWQVSNAGGTRPLWSRDGREVFYLNSSETETWLMVAPVQPNGGPLTGLPTRLLDLTRYINAGFRQFDVSNDGRRFLVIKPESAVDQSAATSHIVVVLNQFSDPRK